MTCSKSLKTTESGVASKLRRSSLGVGMTASSSVASHRDVALHWTSRLALNTPERLVYQPFLYAFIVIAHPRFARLSVVERSSLERRSYDAALTCPHRLGGFLGIDELLEFSATVPLPATRALTVQNCIMLSHKRLQCVCHNVCTCSSEASLGVL
eukprot:2935038-Amphidinium_carterae.1